jgi:hypothetical protein
MHYQQYLLHLLRIRSYLFPQGSANSGPGSDSAASQPDSIGAEQLTFQHFQLLNPAVS